MWQTLRQMIHVSWKQLVVAFFLVSSLLILLQILVVFAWNARQTSQQVQNNLGVFLYLRDDAVQ